VNKAAEYRANAEICRRMADKAESESDKRAWLEMAQSWSFLIKLEDVVPPEASNAANQGKDQRGTLAGKGYSEASLALVSIVNRLKTMLDSAYSSIYSSLANLLK
jgi:hypothetical protein